MLNLEYTRNPNKIIKNQPCFSQVFETRTTFISSHRYMTYDYYKKQPMPMCEIKLNQLLQKNPEIIYSLNRFFYPFIQEYAFILAPASDFPQLQQFERE